MFAKPSPRPSVSQPLKRSDSIASELEMAFLKQPFLEQRLERKHQRTSRKWLRFEATGRTSVVHTDKLQIAEQTGIQASRRYSSCPFSGSSWLGWRSLALMPTVRRVGANIMSDALTGWY